MTSWDPEPSIGGITPPIRSRELLQRVTDVFPLLSKNFIKFPISEPAAAHRPYSSLDTWNLVAPGKANGLRDIDAAADTGASLNIISETIARDLNLSPRPRTSRLITLASGKRVQSPGSVSISWQYKGEKILHQIYCQILPNLPHNLILGAPFLRRTQTFTQYRHRLKKIYTSPVTSTISLGLLGLEQERLTGYIDDLPVLAVPDSGSQGMFMSSSLAKERGLCIDASPQYRRPVQFADGSEEQTTGLLHNVSWTFRRTGTQIHCDFFVLDNLPTNLILSNSFLEEFDVFSAYGDRFINPVQGDKADHWEMFGINFKKCNRRLGMSGQNRDQGISEPRTLADQYQSDVDSEDPFSRDMEHKERARRSEIRQRIDKLPPEEWREASGRELDRQRDWEERRHQHLERRATLVPQEQSSSINPLYSRTAPHRTEERQRRRGFKARAADVMMGIMLRNPRTTNEDSIHKGSSFTNDDIFQPSQPSTIEGLAAA